MEVFGLTHIRLYQCHAVNKEGKCPAQYHCKIWVGTSVVTLIANWIKRE